MNDACTDTLLDEDFDSREVMKSLMVQWKTLKSKTKHVFDDCVSDVVQIDDYSHFSDMLLQSNYTAQTSPSELQTSINKSSAFKNMEFRNHHRLVESKLQ